MTIRKSVLFVGILLPSMLLAQSDSLQRSYALLVDSVDLRKHLTILASDAYEGRETGFAGQKKAAAYLVDYFKSLGIAPISEPGLLENGYEQSFEVLLKRPGGITVSLEGKRYAYLDDLIFFSKELESSTRFDDILFTGYGIRSSGQDDLDGVTCDGCVMLALNGTRNLKGAPSKMEMKDEVSPMQLMNIKSNAAAEAGASVLLLVSDKLSGLRGQFGNFLRSSRMKLVDEPQDGEVVDERKLQTLLISEELADAILRKGGSSLVKEKKKLVKKGNRTRKLAVGLDVLLESSDSLLTSTNVLGYVPGSDLKDELVIITAHYDHVGVMDGIVYNGADDDGSGTVALLELAQAFVQAKKDGYGPRRSILFMAVSGEEKGLLGSEYYSDHPIFSLANTIVDLNVDMIGRHDKEHANDTPYVYIIGSDRLSSDLHAISEEANKRFSNLELDYTFNAEDDPNRFYYRSDHYNFARKGIPVIFYFSGVHEDYHQPGDDVERIEFDRLQRRTRLIFHTAWELANRNERIIVDGVVD